MKVKCETHTFLHFFLYKINFKNQCSTYYSDNTVLVSSDDTSTPTQREKISNMCVIDTSGRHKIRRYKKCILSSVDLVIDQDTCVFAIAEHYFSTTSSGHLWSPQVALRECTLSLVEL